MDIVQIVEFLGAQYNGGSLDITGANTLECATKSQISFLANPRYNEMLAKTKAGAVIVTEAHASVVPNAIISKNPYHDFAKVLHLFAQKEGKFTGISPLSSIESTAKIGNNVTIYPYVFIGDGVVIEDNITIFPHCYIGEYTTIGAYTTIYPSVSIMARSVIKEHCTIAPGAVIGSDGFGFIPTKEGIEAIPQIGNITIENDVYIGANTTIDRAALDTTKIGMGTKVDNLVQIGHNVTIGEHCLIVSQTGISGSTKVGNRVIMAGQAGISGHLTIGDGAVVGPKAGIAKSIPAGETRAGMPATNQMTFLRLSHIFPKLPGIIKHIDTLEERIASLEAKLAEK